MAKKLKILPGGAVGDRHVRADITPAKMLKHFRTINSSLLQDALDTWGDIWDQFQGSLIEGTLVNPENEGNFQPDCGWPEFCEKLWLLRHYLDHAKRFCDGKP
jgi:hypothetical protein